MLGPILFIIFINDLNLAVTMVDIVKKFADDKSGPKGSNRWRESSAARSDRQTN